MLKNKQVETEKEVDRLDLNALINGETDVDTTNIDFISAVALQELLDDKKIKQNSRINKNQVNPLTKVAIFADLFNVGTAKTLVDNILKLQVSLYGRGRREMVEIASKQTYNDLDTSKNRWKDVFR